MTRHIYIRGEWIDVEDGPPPQNAAPYIGGVSMGESSRRDFRHVVTKKQFRDLRTAKDVDRALDNFQARYPHLGRPGKVARDPMPSVNISDRRENNGEWGKS